MVARGELLTINDFNRIPKGVCGVYMILSPVGGIYVGSSCNIKRRFNEYRCQKKTTQQIKVYRSFNKYGIENHRFVIMKECHRDDLYLYEFLTGYSLGVLDRDGLNLKLPKAFETKSCISEEERVRLSRSITGRRHSEETKLKIGIAHKGRPKSDKAKEKLRLANLGKKDSEETKAKKAAVWKNKKHTEATKLKQSDAKKKLIFNTETGIYYLGVKDAAESAGLTRASLSHMLLGAARNRTSFTYA